MIKPWAGALATVVAFFVAPSWLWPAEMVRTEPSLQGFFAKLAASIASYSR